MDISSNKTPQTGYAKTKSSVATNKPVAWKESDSRQFLTDRKERIRIKAISRGLDITGRTLAEIELMLRGYELAPLDTGIPQPSTPGPVTIRHEIDWNSVLPISNDNRQVVTKLHTLPVSNRQYVDNSKADNLSTLETVSDNTPDFMSEQYAPDQFGDFQEILD